MVKQDKVIARKNATIEAHDFKEQLKIKVTEKNESEYRMLYEKNEHLNDLIKGFKDDILINQKAHTANQKFIDSLVKKPYFN